MKYLANVATLEFFPEKCTGCKRCVEVCPHGVFNMNGNRAVLIDRDLCMECGACMNNCAFGAIKVDSGVGCASAYINSILTGGEASCCGDDSGSDESCCC